MSSKKVTIEGSFVPHRREMLESPAWQALSLSARRMLDRIELEYMAHGGPHENARLPVTFDNFIGYGVRRNSVASALREAVALGFGRCVSVRCAAFTRARVRSLSLVLLASIVLQFMAGWHNIAVVDGERRKPNGCSGVRRNSMAKSWIGFTVL